jgi:hypothetical protein
VLGLCEGNYCEGGWRSREAGHGRLVVMYGLQWMVETAEHQKAKGGRRTNIFQRLIARTRRRNCDAGERGGPGNWCHGVVESRLGTHVVSDDEAFQFE